MAVPSDSLQSFPWPNGHYTPLRRRSFRAACSILLITASLAAGQEPTPPCAECLTLVVERGQSSSIPGPLNDARIAVRVPAGGEDAAVAALSQIREGGGRPGLVVVGLPAQPVSGDAAALVRDLFIDIGDATLPVNEMVFLLRSRFTELRGLSGGLRLGLIASRLQRDQLSREIGPYVDVFLEPTSAEALRPSWPAVGSPYAVAVSSADSPGRLPPSARLLLWRAPPQPDETESLVRDLATSMSLLVDDLIAAATVTIRCAGRTVPAYLNSRTGNIVAVAFDCDPNLIDVVPPSVTVTVPLSHGVVLIRVPAPEGQFADDVSVVGRRELTVQEIIARHQAATARQRQLVRTLISSGAMTLTFEAPGFPAPIAISSETVMFQGNGSTEIEQRSIRVNGIEFKGGRVPRLPIIEPERVASPPLAITLSDVYRYSLIGREPCGDATCYVLGFEPVDSTRTLFRGRAWITAGDFAMARVAATQTGLRGPIVSSEQIDDFAKQRKGIWLLSRSEVRQVYEGAAHRTPIHRVLTVATNEVNSSDFEARRRAAYESAAVMLRDTPEGFRYLQSAPPGNASAEPVLAAPANRVRTMVLGVIVDPNISRPLPFAGLSYVNFDLFGTGTQVNAFFGGTYAQVAFLVPSVAASRWQIAGRAFGIATSNNDRAFADGREVYEHNITQRPAHASIWTLRPLTTRLTARAGYELDYTQFGAGNLTAGEFTVPADQVAHSIRLAVEGQQAGWNGSLWWAGSRRSNWRPWGTPAMNFNPAQADYQRYGITLTRLFVLTPALVARLEAAWMDGRDLDRFSRYAFGTFDNRLRGYPSALIRYDRGGVVRGAVAWTAARRLRVDGFVDSAYVHDPGFGPGLRSYSGIGGAIEAPAPFGMLAGAEWGYGFQGVRASGRRGTQVLRITAFKIF